jgi:phage terminase small subunit
MTKAKKKTAAKKKPGTRDVPVQRLRLFVEHYSRDPNQAAAARAAGYKGKAKALSEQGARLLAREDTQRMLAEVTAAAVAAKPGIMTRDERQQWWSDVIRGTAKFETVTMSGEVVEVAASQSMRAKCSELLGKAQGDFVERHEHRVTGQVEFIVQVPPRDKIPEPDA